MLFANSLAALDSIFVLAETVLTPGGTGGSGGPLVSVQWFIVLFFTILGLLVTLSPPRRTTEIKRPKDD